MQVSKRHGAATVTPPPPPGRAPAPTPTCRPAAWVTIDARPLQAPGSRDAEHGRRGRGKLRRVLGRRCKLQGRPFVKRVAGPLRATRARSPHIPRSPLVSRRWASPAPKQRRTRLARGPVRACDLRRTSAPTTPDHRWSGARNQPPGPSENECFGPLWGASTTPRGCN